MADVELTNSILLSVEKMLGGGSEYEHFHQDIITHINSVFFILWQLGVGPSDQPFKITGPDEEWTDFISDENELESVRTYVYTRVKLMFDPPANSTHMESLKNLSNELEWRMNVAEDEAYK